MILLLQFVQSSFPFESQATILPEGFIQTQVGGTWNEAVGMETTAWGPIFVWERSGRIWLLYDGVKGASPFLDISAEVGAWRDLGLLGAALDPNYLNNGYIYLYYVVDRHHLLNFGVGNGGAYDPVANEYHAATQGRITRYTAIKGNPSDPDFSSASTVDYASRLVLHGERPGTGCPILFDSHGTGHLVFGTDDTLLASCGDSASYDTTDLGSVDDTYYADALADGIMRPDENVGAYRSQMLTSLSGKILRLDPLTGLGIPSNPFYEPGNPDSTRSKVWSLGLRNPFRIVLEPGSGSHDPADGDPGALYIGDVGWDSWEELNVADGPGLNFGWPAFEGLTLQDEYWSDSPQNQEALNPLYDGTTCTQQYFEFTDLLQQATLDPGALFLNPCVAAQDITTSPTFFHARPKVDMYHGSSGGARWGSFDGFDAIEVDAGTDTDPFGRSVPAPPFRARSSTGGAFYTGTQFPAEYHGRYLHAEWEHEWIKVFEMDASHEPVRIDDFIDDAGGVVFVDVDPNTGDLYYISWTAILYKVEYIGTGNAPPTAVATADVTWGPSALTVQFDATSSTDPEGGSLTYLWDFGDGTVSTQASLSHVFAGTPPDPEVYTVTLSVTDDGAGQAPESDVTTLTIWTDNTPPLVNILTPVDEGLYSILEPTVQPLNSIRSDLESDLGDLTCSWEVRLHHNDHFHSDPPIAQCSGATTEISPLGCGESSTYWFSILLTVTDEHGLATTDVHQIFPDDIRCPNTPTQAVPSSSPLFMIALASLLLTLGLAGLRTRRQGR